MPRVARAALIVALAAGFVAACGNKGPLVLPDQPPPPKHKKASAPAESKTPGQPAPEQKKAGEDGSGSGGAEAQP